MFYEFGGIGARRGGDGPDATGAFFLGGRSVIPQIEPVEAQYPFVVAAARLLRPTPAAPAGGGAGSASRSRSRCSSDAALTVRGDRIELPPPGVDGGAAGARRARSRWSAPTAASRRWPTTPGRRAPRRRATCSCSRTSGGGGLGPPDERDRRAVRADVPSAG